MLADPFIGFHRGGKLAVLDLLQGLCFSHHLTLLPMFDLISYDEDDVEVALAFFWLIKSK